MTAQPIVTFPTLARVEHPTREQLVARGLAARALVPRSRHAELNLAGTRDPIGLVEEQVRDRIPELVAVRYGRMIDSPFSFYRGAAVIMAADLSRTPSSGLRAQLCGDMHMANFGMFGTPERNHVLDVTDFDETLPGPWEWDVKRLATSFEIAGRADGFSASRREAVVRELARSYRKAMTEFAAQGNLDVWYARLDIDTAMARYQMRLPRAELKRKRKAVSKALTRDSEHAFEKFTRVAGKELRIVSNPPLVVRLDELYTPAERKRFEEAMRGMFRWYRASLPGNRRTLLEQFRIVDIARKAVGVGSVGTRCWIVLLLGVDRTSSRSNRPRPPCSSPIWGGAGTRTTASACGPGSGSCRPRATSFSAGDGRPAPTASRATTTSDNVTGRTFSMFSRGGATLTHPTSSWPFAAAGPVVGDTRPCSAPLARSTDVISTTSLSTSFVHLPTRRACTEASIGAGRFV